HPAVPVAARPAATHDAHARRAGVRASGKGGICMGSRLVVLRSWLLTLGALLMIAPASHAGWPNDPLVNVPLCTNGSDQTVRAIVPDGTGGGIVVWVDSRNGNQDIFARRVNGRGAPQWTADGVVVCNAAGAQNGAVIVSDGAGGAIIAWQDN